MDVRLVVRNALTPLAMGRNLRANRARFDRVTVMQRCRLPRVERIPIVLAESKRTSGFDVDLLSNGFAYWTQPMPPIHSLTVFAADAFSEGNDAKGGVAIEQRRRDVTRCNILVMEATHCLARILRRELILCVGRSNYRLIDQLVSGKLISIVPRKFCSRRRGSP